MPLTPSSSRAGTGGAQLDYVEFTALVTTTATTEGTAVAVVTGSAVVYDGATAVVIEFYCPALQTALTTYDQLGVLFEDGSAIGTLFRARSGIANTTITGGTFQRRMTPTVGSHTYSVRTYLSAAGTGTVHAGAAGAGLFFPGFIRITEA